MTKLSPSQECKDGSTIEIFYVFCKSKEKQHLIILTDDVCLSSWVQPLGNPRWRTEAGRRVRIGCLHPWLPQILQHLPRQPWLHYYPFWFHQLLLFAASSVRGNSPRGSTIPVASLPSDPDFWSLPLLNP